MPDPIITNNDLGSVLLKSEAFEAGVITFGGAGTLLEGTILARDTSTLKFIAYVKGGATNGNGIPKAVLTYPVTAAGAGDVAARPAVSGEFRLERLVIDADGDASNIDNTVRDEMRDYGLVSLSVTETNIVDNQ